MRGWTAPPLLKTTCQAPTTRGIPPRTFANAGWKPWRRSAWRSSTEWRRNPTKTFLCPSPAAVPLPRKCSTQPVRAGNCLLATPLFLLFPQTALPRLWASAGSWSVPRTETTVGSRLAAVVGRWAAVRRSDSVCRKSVRCRRGGATVASPNA